MANQWDEKIKGFLKKTGEDFKRAGNDIKAEAQKLMTEVKDPEGQAKIKEGLKDFGGWAKKTAVEVAELAETGFKKAEGAFREAGKNWTPPAEGATEKNDDGEPPAPVPSVTPPSAPPEMDEAPPIAGATPAKKTIGKKKDKAPEKAPAKAKAGSKKTIGKKPSE